MTLQQSYEIVIFDNDKEKDIKYLPIHIKSIDNDLHEKIIKFIKSENKDKTTHVFDGYGGFIKQPNRVENVYKKAVNSLKSKVSK